MRPRSGAAGIRFAPGHGRSILRFAWCRVVVSRESTRRTSPPGTGLPIVAALTASIAFLAGCGPPESAIRPLDIRTYTAPREAVAPPATPPAPPAAGGPRLEYVLPEGWVDAGGSGMRLATLKAGDGAEITVIGASGSLESNVSRWQGQLTPDVDPARVARAIEAGAKVAVQDVEGTIVLLDDGATDNPQSILAAVIPVDASTSLFVKFKGAADVARRLREPFTAFVRSIRWK